MRGNGKKYGLPPQSKLTQEQKLTTLLSLKNSAKNSASLALRGCLMRHKKPSPQAVCRYKKSRIYSADLNYETEKASF